MSPTPASLEMDSLEAPPTIGHAATSADRGPRNIESVDTLRDVENSAANNPSGDNTTGWQEKSGWDGPDDPANPMNWPAYKRTMQVICVALMALVVNLATTMFAPGAEQLVDEFSITSDTVTSLTVSIYVLGFALGPLFWAPLSELYGRLPIYICSGILYIGFTIGCAFVQNIGGFIALRVLAGCSGACSMALSGGTLADVIPKEARGKWMGLFILGPLVGPVTGPIAGGFIAQSVGWRWVFRVILITCGVLGLLCIAFLRETYAPAILRRRHAAVGAATQAGAASRLGRDLMRPLRLLVLSPIVLFLSLYVAFAFGLMFLLFTSFSSVYTEQYGWSTGISGLSYLGLGVGMVAAVATQAKLGDSIARSRAAKRGASKPEDRLPLMAYMSPALAVGMFWYGWSVDKQAHWIVPILGTVFVGWGIVFATMPQMIYLVEVYGSEAGASALAANTVLRSLGGAFLPLAGPALNNNLGLGWGNSLLGFLVLAFLPVPWVLFLYGEKIRLSSRTII